VARVPLALKLTGVPKRNAKAIEATLDRLAAHFAADTDNDTDTESGTDSTE
jgi:hypothetical protein